MVIPTGLFPYDWAAIPEFLTPLPAPIEPILPVLLIAIWPVPSLTPIPYCAVLSVDMSPVFVIEIGPAPLTPPTPIPPTVAPVMLSEFTTVIAPWLSAPMPYPPEVIRPPLVLTLTAPEPLDET